MGRRPRFTLEEEEEIRDVYRTTRYGLAHLARLYRCSPTTINRIVERRTPPMPRTKKDPTDLLIEAAYYRTCNGIPISVMEITNVFKEGRRALAAGEDLDQAIRAFVETIRL